MLRHVVMFKWNDDVDDAHVEAVAAGLDGLTAVIPEIRRYSHGADLELSDTTFDYAVVGDFASRDDYVTYRDHPVHQEFIQSLVVDHVSQRCAVQFEVD